MENKEIHIETQFTIKHLIDVLETIEDKSIPLFFQVKDEFKSEDYQLFINSIESGKTAEGNIVSIITFTRQ